MSSKTAGARMLAERYARALLDVVLDKKGDLDRVGRELRSVAELLAETPKLAHVLSTPTIPDEERVAVLGRILHREDFSPYTVNTLRLLTTKERMPLLPEVVDGYERRVLEHKKIQPGQVVSAYPLSEEQQSRLAGRLGETLGKKMELTYHTDSEMTGGLIVRIGNRVFDASVATQLLRFKEKALSSL